MATANVKPFNTETAYLLWDDEHFATGVRFARENGNSFVFDDNGTELVLVKENVINLGSSHPPAQKEAGKHYISTDDSGASNQEYSLPPSEESQPSGFSGMFGNSQASGGTTGSEESQSGGRRKNGKKRKTKRKSRKGKARKGKSRKGKSSRK
jgi:hypothetical protein